MATSQMISPAIDGPRRSRAFHEAARAVVQYRVCGRVGGSISLGAATTTASGRPRRALTDTTFDLDAKAQILGCFAGRIAEVELDPAAPPLDDADEDVAATVLNRWHWSHRAAVMRAEALAVVREYWPDITAVAEALLESDVLDDTEIAIIADAASADVSPADALAEYRAQRRTDVRS